MWAPTFRILRNILRWLPSREYQLLGRFLYGARTTVHTHPHTHYIHIFFQVAESFGPAFCTESGSFFSIRQSCICSSWLGDSAARLGGIQHKNSCQSSRYWRCISFIRPSLSLKPPTASGTKCSIYIYICSTCWKRNLIDWYCICLLIPLDFLLCIGSELWNGRTIAICVPIAFVEFAFTCHDAGWERARGRFELGTLQLIGLTTQKPVKL